MDLKKLKILLYLPLALLFIANLFYYPLPAQAVCSWTNFGEGVFSKNSCLQVSSTLTEINQDGSLCPTSKPADSYHCCCEPAAVVTNRTCEWRYAGTGINKINNCGTLGLSDVVGGCADIAIPSSSNNNDTDPTNYLCCCKSKTAAPATTAKEKTSFTPQIGIGTEFPAGTPQKFSDNSTSMIATYIKAIYKYAIGIVGILAAVVLMVGGVMWILAGGSATTIGEAKSWIGASLTGLVLALCSYLILATVNPALVNLQTSTVHPVTTDITAKGAIGTCATGSKIGDSCNNGAGWCDTVRNCFGKADENDWCGDGSGQCYSAATLQTLNPKPALVSGGRPCISSTLSCYKASKTKSF